MFLAVFVPIECLSNACILESDVMRTILGLAKSKQEQKSYYV